ncbi:unnamed protein product, partial [Sphagnum troendelagicum]
DAGWGLKEEGGRVGMGHKGRGLGGGCGGVWGGGKKGGKGVGRGGRGFGRNRGVRGLAEEKLGKGGGGKVGII